MFNDDLKRRVRDSVNILDLIQSAVGKLTRAGRNYKACCPFHHEKTPSFNVNPDGQFFKCFGCGKSGDIFTFVMLHERVEFPEALKILADRAGIPFEPDPKAAVQYQKEKDWKSYLFKLNDVAARFFRDQLFTPAGQHALAYLHKRGLNKDTCERFGMGYAPGTGSPLLQKLLGQKAPLKAILAAGLASERDNGQARDFFFDRLMFPIRDVQGRTIAFGGRILGDGEPKYLNTRETPLFSKTKTVYAIDMAAKKIVETRKAILVEGYTDVMMCHQFGIENVVACLGTAITSEHIRHLRRLADEVVMMTDSDAAGAKASERSLAVLFGESMPAKIARLPGADKDPCDFLLAKGRDAFLEALSQPVELFDYKLERTLATHDIRSPMGHKAAAQELMELVSLIPDPILRNELRRRVSAKLNIAEDELKFDAPRKSLPEEPAAPQRSSNEPDIGVTPKPETPAAAAERALLQFLFHEPAWMGTAMDRVTFGEFTGRYEKTLAHALLLAIHEGKLPPEPSILSDGNASSIVAREVFEKLDAMSASGVSIPNGTQQVCFELAGDAPPVGKLDVASRFEMLAQPVELSVAMAEAQAAKRAVAHARSVGDVDGEEKAFARLSELLQKIARLKKKG